VADPGPAWIPIPDGSGFGLDNLPLGIGGTAGHPPHAHVAVGDHALDLGAAAAAGCLDGLGIAGGAFDEPTLNTFLAAGPDAWRGLRRRLQELLVDGSAADLLRDAVVARSALELSVPVAVGDYVDFYSSIHHATNLGRLFRPDAEPLLPNWRHLPVGYHGRAGTIIATGEDVARPRGLRLVDGEPVEGPSGALDIELEVGFVVGAGNVRGEPIDVLDADDHIYGVLLVNDWSARDLQAFEYQPLGPFLGKSFATSVSPWLVSLEALAPFRVAPPPQVPPVAGYLHCQEPWGLDLHLEVLLETAAMRDSGMAPAVISSTGFADMYWTPAQQLAHITVNGASTATGDLFASGTVSGPTPGSEGSLIELTWRGERPLTLPDGCHRSFLADGDRVTLRGWAGGDGRSRIDLGEVSGTVVPA
jgi:fumarylacetoacetase